MELSEELVGELTRLMCPADDEKRGGGLDRKAVAAGLTCLAAITATRRGYAEMVRLGAVPAAVRVLEAGAGSPSQALRVLEAAVGCAEGATMGSTEDRATVCESARMGGAEAAVSPTLPVRARQHGCHGLYAPIPLSNLRCI
jgi:hypothetical protein